LDQLPQLYESLTRRDVVQIGILALVIYFGVHFLGRKHGSGMIRGLGLVVIGLFLVVQVVVASFDLTELSRVLDYLLAGLVLATLVIFQPELRRGLMLLGRSRVWRYLVHNSPELALRLANVAESLARENVGALIAVQREVGLTTYIESGERLDAEVSSELIRTVFFPRSPLHDGALILCDGRIAAAACQLPLGQIPARADSHLGMRHRAALGLSEETDAVVLVVSEETGRVSLAVHGRLEAVPNSDLAERLTALLCGPNSSTRE
jgi:diadenylate cyclase